MNSPNRPGAEDHAEIAPASDFFGLRAVGTDTDFDDAFESGFDGEQSQDLSALSWVHEELKRSFDAANKSLRRHMREAEAAQGADVDVVDPAILRGARQQLHQGVGALELVGLPEAATVLKACEVAVQRYIAKPARIDAKGVDAIEKASFALVDYVSRMLAGKQVSPLSLFPQYRAVQEASGADRVHPADLWSHAWQWRELPDDLTAEPRQPDAATRGLLEQHLLQLMRGANTAATAAAMSDLCAGLGAGALRRDQALLWKLAAAFFEGLSRGLLVTDVFSKRVASRLLAQFRIIERGGKDVSEQLAQDILFFCSQSSTSGDARDAAVAPRLAAVKEAYGLSAQPTVNYSAPSLGRFDPAWVAQAKKRVIAAKDTWSAVAAAELHRLQGLSEQFSLVGDSIERLFPGGADLAHELMNAVNQTIAAEEAPPPLLAMEVATAMLYVEASLDDLHFDEPGQEQRIRRLAERIAAVRSGKAPEPLEPWMEELYHRVSHRQTMDSVVQELRAAMAESEQAIDQFFRNPTDSKVLEPVPGQLLATRGVLAVLGVDPAQHTVSRMSEDVERLITGEVAGDEAQQAVIFERLASNLGALHFLIDMLAVQPQIARKVFRFDAEQGVLKPLNGRTLAQPRREPRRSGPASQSRLIDQVRSLAVAAGREDVSLADVTRELQRLSQQAVAADQPSLAAAVSKARAALEAARDEHELAAARDQLSSAMSDFALTASDVAGLEPLPVPAPAVGADTASMPQVVTSPPTQQASAAAPGADASPAPGEDDEMLAVFIEEAGEVVRDARQSLQALAEAPEDMGELASVRRAFHTLKGSSRMVGLKAFGDAAWAGEQLLNECLAEQKPVDANLQAFARLAVDYLDDWAQGVERGEGEGAHRAPVIEQMADAVREGRRPSLDDVARAEPAVAPASALPTAAAEEVAPGEALAAAVLPAFGGGVLPPLPSLDLAPASGERVGDVPDLSFDAPEPARASEPESIDFKFDFAPSVQPLESPVESTDVSAEPSESAFSESANLDSDLPSDSPQSPPGAFTLGFPEDLPSAADLDLTPSPALPVAQAIELDSIEEAAPSHAAEDGQPIDIDHLDLDLSDAAEQPVSTEALASQDNLADSLSDAFEQSMARLTKEPEPAESLPLPSLDTMLEADVPIDLPVANDSPLAMERSLLPNEFLVHLPPTDAIQADESVGDASETPSSEQDQGPPAPLSEVDIDLGFDESFGSEAGPIEAFDASEVDIPLAMPEDLEAVSLPVPELGTEAVELTADELAAFSGESLEQPVPEHAGSGFAPLPPEEVEQVALLEPFDEPLADEQVKVVGPLRIGIPLFNIYLNEADELSRRLIEELQEWSLELHRPVGDTSIALAHSLGGSSATVGFQDLSHLSRVLESALGRSNALGHGSPEEAQLFSDAAEEIRRLLHQFAAGFLKTPPQSLLDRLAEHEVSSARRLEQMNIAAGLQSERSDFAPLSPDSLAAFVESQHGAPEDLVERDAEGHSNIEDVAEPSVMPELHELPELSQAEELEDAVPSPALPELAELAELADMRAKPAGEVPMGYVQPPLEESAPTAESAPVARQPLDMPFPRSPDARLPLDFPFPKASDFAPTPHEDLSSTDNSALAAEAEAQPWLTSEQLPHEVSELEPPVAEPAASQAEAEPSPEVSAAQQDAMYHAVEAAAWHVVEAEAQPWLTDTDSTAEPGGEGLSDVPEVAATGEEPLHLQLDLGEAISPEPNFAPPPPAEPESEAEPAHADFDSPSSGFGTPSNFAPSGFAELTQVELKPLGDLPSIDSELSRRLETLHFDDAEEPQDEDDDIDAVDAVDAELFPIFEEEALDLLPQLHNQMQAWTESPGRASAAAPVMRTLHTFKGGARLAGAMRLGELAHRLEGRIETVLRHEGEASQADVDALQAKADALANAFDALRRRQGAPASLEAELPDARPELPEASIDVSYAEPAPAESMPFEPLPEPGFADAPLNEQPADEPAPFDADVEAHATEPPADLPEPPVLSDVVDPAEYPSFARSAVSAQQPAVPIDWSRFIVSAQSDTAAEAPSRSAAHVGGGSVRVRAPLLERMVNQAGEVSITRARLESEVSLIKGSLSDLTDNLQRLREQLRDVEFQAETQLSSRLEAAKAAAQTFDPLEFDRFTRLQELTRMMAESVNDVATVQRTLQRSLESAEDHLAAQGRLTRDLQDDLLRTRMVEFESLSDRLYRVVRQAAKETGKQVRLDIVGGSIELDRGVLDRMSVAFEHLVRNCVTHGIESPAQRTEAGKDPTGTIVIAVAHEGNEVSVEFRDDGGGLDLLRIRERGVAQGLLDTSATYSDADLANLIFMPGFSTASVVTELAGRGVGMDVVRSEINALGGRIETATAWGRGASFRLLLPLTTAVTQVVMVRSGSTTVAIPSTLIEIVRRTPAVDVEAAYAEGQFDAGDRKVPFFWLGALLQQSRRSADAPSRTVPILIVRSAQQRIALHVDEVLGNQEVVVKNLGPQMSRMPGLVAITILPSGSMALIYNPVALATVYGDSAQAAMRSADVELKPSEPVTVDAGAAPVAPLVLVVDDSLTVRRVTQRLLVREGYRVTLAKDGLEALERLAQERPAVVLSDIEMPRMDGFDLVRNIRADAKLRGLPVIMITSRIAQKHRDYAQELGVDHYLGKPYSEEDLLALISSYVGPAQVVSAY